MISLDTLRPDRLGCYGCPDPVSPFLDRISQQSMCLTDILAQVPSTIGSHRCIFLSRYLHQTANAPPEPSETLAGRLLAAGYRTAAYVDGGLMNRKYGNNPGFELYDDEAGGLAAILPKARSWLANRGNAPFFLFIHTYDVHCPYEPAQPYDTIFNDPYPVWFETRGKCGDSYYNKQPLQAPDFRHIRGLYDGGIREADSRLLEFFRDMYQMDLLACTMVVFFSDHGESLGERGYVGHNQLYDVQLRILGLFRVPDRAGYINGHPAESVDLAPTILKHLGCHASCEGLAGIDLIAGGTDPRERRPRLSETHDKTFRVDDQWKAIIRRQADSDELYSVFDDPEDTHNMKSLHPEALSALLREYLNFTGIPEVDLRRLSPHGFFRVNHMIMQPGKTAPVQTPSDSEIKLKKQLIELGYIDS